MDCIGPWKIPLCRNRVVDLQALTTINPCTNLLKIKQLQTKTSKYCAQTLSNNWLVRYPWPLRCVQDQGPGFMGAKFQALLHCAGVLSVPTTAGNPQRNSIIKWILQAIDQVTHTLVEI